MKAYFLDLTTRIRNNKHFKFGLPFLVLVVGSTFLLKPLGQIRYNYRQTSQESQNDIEKYGLGASGKDKPSMEDVHEDYMNKTFTDDYSMKRGPRAWEPDSFKDHIPEDHVAKQSPRQLRIKENI